MILSFSVRIPCLQHHPDKPSGDVDTFRTLKRAQTVLSNPKLRQQYDILGLDLDDDEVEQTGVGSEDGGAESQTSSQTIVQDIASAALTAVLQFGVRTGTERICCVGFDCLLCGSKSQKHTIVSFPECSLVSILLFR